MSIDPIHRGLSGDIIVQLKAAKPTPVIVGALVTWLETVGPANPLSGLSFTLEPLIRAVSPAQILALEGPGRPISLRSFYRLYLRELPLTVAQIDATVAYLRLHAPVAYAYTERSVSPAALVWHDPAFAPDQAHLESPPTGVGARDFWQRDLRGATAAGRDAHLYAVEHGWEIHHTDLLRHKLGAPIHGDNAADLPVKDATALRRVNHGTAALSVAVGSDDAPGRIGVAPAVASVRLSSCFEIARNIGEHVASAIVSAVQDKVQRQLNGAVLMLQVQRDFGWPTEVDLADFLAIQVAVNNGLTPVQPAGNGGRDLSGQPWPDSGALMVGALGGGGRPRADSNYGARVNLWAPGQDLRCAGAPLNRGLPDRSAGPISTLRREDFGGTSGATAVMAGAALCLLGRAAQRGVLKASALDLRDWMEPRFQHGNLDGLPAIDDRLLVAHAPPLPPLNPKSTAFPWRFTATRGGANPLSVSNPQAGEGNTDVVQRDPAYPNGAPDAVVGFVRLPPLSGQNMPHSTPGAAPVSAGTNDPPWVERWVLTDAKVMNNPPDVMVLQFDDGDSTSNPNGQIWGQDVVDYFQARGDYDSDWRLAQVSFKYKDVPPAPSPAVSDSGCTLRHYDIHRNHSGSWEKAGELRRQIKSSTEIVDHWMLFGNYLFADAGKDVRLTRVSAAESTSTQSWLGTMYTASTGSPPKPVWYAKASYTIGTF